jgi:hypothetical protein
MHAAMQMDRRLRMRIRREEGEKSGGDGCVQDTAGRGYGCRAGAAGEDTLWKVLSGEGHKKGRSCDQGYLHTTM